MGRVRLMHGGVSFRLVPNRAQLLTGETVDALDVGRAIRRLGSASGPPLDPGREVALDGRHVRCVMMAVMYR